MHPNYTYKDGDAATMQAKHDAYVETVAKRNRERYEQGRDDDSWLSQWGEGITQRTMSLAVQLAEKDWMATFNGLATLDGEFVEAKQIETQYGTRWFIPNPPEGCAKFAPYRPKRQKTLAKYGYKGVVYKTCAMVITDGRGTGLSGTCWVTYERDKYAEKERGITPVIIKDEEDR